MTPPVGILAIDLDGTLIAPGGEVGRADADAIGRARDAGVLVLPCTGRTLAECRGVLAQFSHTGPAVVAGGAMICDTVGGATMHRFGLARAPTAAVTGIILDAGHAALVLKDPSEAGHDYLVVTGDAGHAIDPVSAWWFGSHGLAARVVPSLDADTHPDATVRVGIVADAAVSVPLVQRIAALVGPGVVLHSFPALAAGGLGRAGGREVHVLEVFDRRAHKWGAVGWVAAHLGLAHAPVAAIGDHVNDVSMLRGADIGIAMGNAAPEALAAAGFVTLACGDGGVAHAIDRVLGGEWAPAPAGAGAAGGPR